MMRTKAFFLSAVVAAGLLSLGPASCPKKPSSARSPTIVIPRDLPALPRYLHDENLGITLNLPEGWSITKRPENPVLLASPPNAGVNGPLINVVIERLNNRMDPYDYLSANILTLQASLIGLQIRKWAVEIVDQRTIAWIHYVYPQGGTQVEGVAYCQTKEYRAYVVTGLAPAENFASYEALFRAIGLSLKID